MNKVPRLSVSSSFFSPSSETLQLKGTTCLPKQWDLLARANSKLGILFALCRMLEQKKYSSRLRNGSVYSVLKPISRCHVFIEFQTTLPSWSTYRIKINLKYFDLILKFWFSFTYIHIKELFPSGREVQYLHKSSWSTLVSINHKIIDKILITILDIHYSSISKSYQYS